MQKDSMKGHQATVSTEYTSNAGLPASAGRPSAESTPKKGAYSRRSVPATAGRPVAGTQATAGTPGKCSGNIRTPVAARTLTSIAPARQGP